MKYEVRKQLDRIERRQLQQSQVLQAILAAVVTDPAALKQLTATLAANDAQLQAALDAAQP